MKQILFVSVLLREMSTHFTTLYSKYLMWCYTSNPVLMCNVYVILCRVPEGILFLLTLCLSVRAEVLLLNRLDGRQSRSEPESGS